jgi:hypothetical protein
MLWGTREHLRDLFCGGAAALETKERTFTFRFPSAERFVEFFRLWYGPTLRAFSSLDDDARAALELDLVELARSFDRLRTDAVAIPATYLESVVVRR